MIIQIFDDCKDAERLLDMMKDGVARTFEDGAFSNLRTLSRPRSHMFCANFMSIKVSRTILILYWLCHVMTGFKDVQIRYSLPRSCLKNMNLSSLVKSDFQMI